MLSIHLNRHSQRKADKLEGERTIILDHRNQQQTQQGQQQFKREEKANYEEELIMLPLEDITLISSKSEIKRGKQADVKSNIEPIQGLSENCCDRCCARLHSFCCSCCQESSKIAPHVENKTIIYDQDPNRNTDFTEERLPPPPVVQQTCCSCKTFLDRFRCWCCRKKTILGFIKRTNTVTEQQAERVITITIEYSKYSHLDSASNARLLANQDQTTYYKDKFKSDAELKFYLIHSTELESTIFEAASKDAETFCRTVMQVKAMKSHYPSDTELEKIMDQPIKRTFGLVFHESILQLSINPITATQGDLRAPALPQSYQRPAIQQHRTTASQLHAESKKPIDEEDDFQVDSD